jgi:hypothetical protein
MVINEDLAKEIGLEGATVYSYVSVILSTDFYKDRFKGCRVKGKKYTAFISISKLKYMNIGLFEIKKRVIMDGDEAKVYNTTVVTPKGVHYFINKFLGKGMK